MHTNPIAQAVVYFCFNKNRMGQKLHVTQIYIAALGVNNMGLSQRAFNANDFKSNCGVWNDRTKE